MTIEEHIESTMKSERFENVTAQIYSHLMATSPDEQPFTAQQAMDYAMTAAYMFSFNYDAVFKRHMVQRLQDAKAKQK